MKTPMKIVRELVMGGARSSGGLIEVSVRTREEARSKARRLLPMRLQRQALIYISEEALIVHIGALENETCIRCWTPICDGEPHPSWKFGVVPSDGSLQLGYPRGEDAPLLFEGASQKEVKEGKETKEGKK